MKRLNRGRACLVSLLLGLSGVSCDGTQTPPPEGLTRSEWETMWEWLSCDECTDGELDSLLALENPARTVPFLSRYLRDTTSVVFTNMRRRYHGAYQRLQNPPRPESAYVADMMANFRAMVRTRAAVVLAGLGYWDTLRVSLDSAKAWDFRNDEVEGFQDALFGRIGGFSPTLEPAELMVLADASISPGSPPPEIFRCTSNPAAFSPPGPGRCYAYAGPSESGWTLTDNGVDRIYTFSTLSEGVYEVRSNLAGLDSTVLVVLSGSPPQETVRFRY